ncbi:hypothetical protein AN446_16600, partial [Pseudomonas aeruginosa]
LDTWFSSGLWTFSTLGWPGRLGRLRGGLLGGGGTDSGFFAHAGLLPFYVFSYAVPHSMPLPGGVR